MQGQYLGTGAILCAMLLRQVDAQLVLLLRSLEAAEWELPTVAGSWRVRDVAAHLLDTPLRKLSILRDGCMVDPVQIRSAEELAQVIHRLNGEGVKVYRRLSPKLLIDWLEQVCAQSASFHEALDPYAPAAFAVSWAGECESLNWFDTARELTERWHHQQQIRLATQRPGIMTPELYRPVLDCFLRGLPYCLRDVQAPEGTSLLLEVAGDCGGQWQLTRGHEGWSFSRQAVEPISTRLTIPQEIAWRVFTKGISWDETLLQVKIEGDEQLAQQALRLTAIVA
jgi:uncharacterized protein (TIGR03083 family)